MQIFSTIAILATVGCSSSSGAGHASVSGTVGGASFAVEDAVVLVDQAHKFAKIAVSSTPETCADVRDNIARQNAKLLLMMVFDADPADAKLSTGAYTTTDPTPAAPRTALFESHATDARCEVSYVPPPDGTGTGTVTLTSVTDTTVTGTFDVVLESGEHVTGTFKPSACPELAQDHAPPTCMP